MEQEKPSKQAMHNWVDAIEEAATQIREHVEPLPEENRGWTDADFYEVAQIWAKVGFIGQTCNDLHEGIGHILMEKMRIDAERN